MQNISFLIYFASIIHLKREPVGLGIEMRAVMEATPGVEPRSTDLQAVDVDLFILRIS